MQNSINRRKIAGPVRGRSVALGNFKIVIENEHSQNSLNALSFRG
jgi:hypothetical protein